MAQFSQWDIGACGCGACGGAACWPCAISLNTIHDGTIALNCTVGLAGATGHWNLWIGPCENLGSNSRKILVWCSGGCTVYAAVYWPTFNTTCSGAAYQIHKYVNPSAPGTCADAMLLDLFGTPTLADDIMTLNSTSCSPMNISLTENSSPFVTHTFTP